VNVYLLSIRPAPLHQLSCLPRASHEVLHGLRKRVPLRATADDHPQPTIKGDKTSQLESIERYNVSKQYMSSRYRDMSSSGGSKDRRQPQHGEAEGR
jgi:hypothetical protein